MCSLPPSWRTACEIHPGLWYIPDFVGEDVANEMTEAIYASDDAWHALSSRRLQMFGGAPHPDGAVCEPLPPWLGGVSDGAAEAMGGDPDFCLVNSYTNGGGISLEPRGGIFPRRASSDRSFV